MKLVLTIKLNDKSPKDDEILKFIRESIHETVLEQIEKRTISNVTIEYDIINEEGDTPVIIH